MCFSIASMVAAELVSRKSVDNDCISLLAVDDDAGSSSWLPNTAEQQIKDKAIT